MMRATRTMSGVAVLTLLALALTASIAVAGPAPTPRAAQQVLAVADEAASPGLATPEEAVAAYLDGVAALDVEQILGATAVDEVSDGHRFDRTIDRLGVFLPDLLAPAEHAFYADINRAQLSGRVLSQARNLSYSLLALEPIEERIFKPVDTAWAKTFVVQVDPFRLDGLTVEDIRFPVAGLLQDDRHIAWSAAVAETYGADEATERLALVAFEGNPYAVGFSLLRYGDTWKVLEQSSPLGQMDAVGWARPISIVDYITETKGE